VCVEISARMFGWGNWEATQTSGQSVCGTRLESGIARLQSLSVVVTGYSPPHIVICLRWWLFILFVDSLMMLAVVQSI
jgi:hypothetical protein